NPQSAAVLVSLSGVLSLWMAIHDPKRSYRPLWFSLTSLDLVLLAWTGSRMAVLAFILGALVSLRHQLGRRIAPVAVAFTGAYTLYGFFSEYGVNDAALR